MYIIFVVILSAWVSLSLPHAADVAVQACASYWPVVERDKVALVAVEITIAVLLMICLNPCRHDFS